MVSLFAVVIIPDSVRADCRDNLFSGLVMHVVGPQWARLRLCTVVVVVWFLFLAGSVVKTAQHFRSVTNDVDAMGFADLFLEDEGQVDPDGLNGLYVLVNFRPAITNKNWRMHCGVASYDNTLGLPPFFPTRLRSEDYRPPLDPAAGRRRRPRGCGAEPPPVQLHAEPGRHGDLQRGGFQTCSSGRSRVPSPGSTSWASASTTIVR